MADWGKDGNQELKKLFLGIEFGSTRIKAVLIDEKHTPLVSGSHDWENRYENEIWTYGLQDIWAGLQDCYQDLKKAYSARYQRPLTNVTGMGFSGMMHGYMAFDGAGTLLVPFRTWRNTMTGPAAEELSELFQFNIPQRWSIAHLYQAILNGESHVKEIRYLTTLAGYIHWKLTGRQVLGVGEASGMFPIDSLSNTYDSSLVEKFDQRIAGENLPWKLLDILPKVLVAGADAGRLTAAGARLLDPSGDLPAGIPLCPPEGDAGTGMVATNSVAERTCNVSAGTSIFAMVVLEKALSQRYAEIDRVTTPTGKPVAMVHANNCTSDLNAWVELFQELTQVLGVNVSTSQLFESLFNHALKGEVDGGGLLAYNYFSGEPITRLEKGAPLFVRTPESHFSLANFMRTHLYAALGTLKIGMDILFGQEHVKVDQVLGHGGFFKTPGVGQRIMAAAMNTPVSVMKTAGEGGAWGIALLAAYCSNHRDRQSLEDYLNNEVFCGENSVTLNPDPEDVEGFAAFMKRYTQGLAIERAAIQVIK